MPHSKTHQQARRSFLKGAALAGVTSAAAIILPGRSTISSADPRPKVVATTGILSDLAKQVAGDDAVVKSLIPEGGDPHTFEPLPRHIRDISYADLALSNYLMLEEQSLIKTIDANLPSSSKHLALAEEASSRGATIIPLVESRSLDTVWLGLRVAGKTDAATRLNEATLSLISSEYFSPAQLEKLDAETPEPGVMHGYITGTFGEPNGVFNSAQKSARKNSISLPMDAHMHMSWAFTQPGIYKAKFQATFSSNILGENEKIEATLFVAAGINAQNLPQAQLRALGLEFEGAAPEVIAAGHADLTVGINEKALFLRIDDLNETDAKRDVTLNQIVVHVPPKALLPVPADPAFRFIATGGKDVYQLPQAVLGKHVHGEIDPHLWHDVTNAQAYVEVIRDHLSQLDPSHASNYAKRAAKYLTELDELDRYVQASIDSIPSSQRNLVTTHDAYGYLANRYGLEIAATVSPTPGVEPSLADRRRLAATLTDLEISSVFIEANAGPVANSLIDAAQEAKVGVFPIWGDAFTRGVNTYDLMMRANADSIARGLGGKALGEHDLRG